ncbi:MAG TPA: undecaprenyl-diphosphatase UppP [bacterium]|nr:undecaprenyl-diphosphatase UppP [bacterium]
MVAISGLQAIVLGLVQGLTEYIPVSSTAHLRIVPALLGWGDPGAAFSAVIQLGTLVAVLLYFARDIGRFTVAALASLVSAEARRSPDARMAWAIAAGNLPIVVLGLGFRHVIETELRSLYIIGTMLIVIALGLWWAERRGTGEAPMEGLTFRRVMAIGAFQALALIPGSSRSGSTILGGLLLGLKRADAARFSFLLGIPAILGAALLELPHVLAGVRAGELTGTSLVLGLLTACVVGYASIAFLLRYLERRTTLLFIVYRLGLAGVVLGLAASGVIR